MKRGTFSYANAQFKKDKITVSLRKLVDIDEFDIQDRNIAEKWDFKFYVKFVGKTFILLAKTYEDKQKWIKAFKTILSLKSCDNKLSKVKEWIQKRKERKRKEKKTKKKKTERTIDIEKLLKRKGPKETISLPAALPLREKDINSVLTKNTNTNDEDIYGYNKQNRSKRNRTRLQENLYSVSPHWVSNSSRSNGKDLSVSQRDRSAPPIDFYKSSKKRAKTSTTSANVVVINHLLQKSRNQDVFGKTLTSPPEEPNFEYDWDNEASVIKEHNHRRFVTCYE